jgi:hypothetical protein
MDNMLNMKYQVVLFGDFSKINNDTQTISMLLNSLSKYNMLPSMFTEMEISPQSPFPVQSSRISFINPETGFNIMFGVRRIEIFQQITVEDGSNMKSVHDFALIVQDILSLLVPCLATTNFSRLAFISEYFLSNTSEEQKNAIYKKLINLSLTDLPVTEWNVRSAFKDTEPDFYNENINNLLSIERSQGMLIIQNKNLALDDIKVTIDINTDATNQVLKYDLDKVNKFLTFFENLYNKNLTYLNSNIFKA